MQEITRRVFDESVGGAKQVMIFPEGTCGNSNTLFRFNKGPFSLGKPVQLACFLYPYYSYNPAYIGRCLGGNELGDIIVRLSTQFVNRIEMRILPVHYPTEEELTSEPAGMLYAQNMQREMARELGCNTSDATRKEYDAAQESFNKARREHELELEEEARLKCAQGTELQGGGPAAGSPGECTLSDAAGVLREASAGAPVGGNKASDCVQGEVWWPWTAYTNVLHKVKEMRDAASRGAGPSKKRSGGASKVD